MKTIETTVYTFDELSDKAKEKAREWYRELLDEQDYATHVIDDAACEVAKCLGVTFDRRPYKTVGGATRYEPKIYWSGFSSQGDGASFEGDWYSTGEALAKIKEYAPRDAMLHEIASMLDEAHNSAPGVIHAWSNVRGHYVHSGCMDIEMECVGDCYALEPEVERSVIGNLRQFANWVYKQLEESYEYASSDEAVDESLVANEYTFTAEGKRFG